MASKKTFDYDIGILGGGAAGLTVASGAAQLGASTLLIEREPKLGGDCLHYGCVPSKTLIRSAQVYHQMKNAERYGLPKMDVPPVDFRKITRRIQDVIDVIQVHDSVERFCSLGARVTFGQAEFADEHSVRLNGKLVSARQWVIATGSSPAIPRLPGLDRTDYITNRELFSLEKLPGSLIVIGGGPIAIEMAQAFQRLGSKVTVIQRSEHILTKEDPDLSDMLLQQLRAEGMTVYTGTKLKETRRYGADRVEVFFEMMGPQGRMITKGVRGEQLLIASGRQPNTQGLGLEQIDLLTDRGHIAVDARMRTRHAHIFAAGDVTGQYQFTHAAGYEGGIVISNAIFHLPRKADYTYFPWVTYTEPELASIGLNEAAAAKAGIRYSVWTEEFHGNDRALAEGETVGRIKLLLDEKEKPIGVQILGTQAGELVGQWVVALAGGVKLSTMASAVQPYPTVAEINKRVAGSVLSGKIFSDRVRKGLKFFFNLKGRACVPEKSCKL